MVTTPDLISIFSSIVSAVVALAALVLSYVVYRHSQKVAEVQDVRQQAALQLQQRQLIVPLWEYLSKTAAIDPERPDERNVVDNVNVLELVALCYESNAIDTTLIKRTFREKYMEIFRTIAQLPKMASGKNGTDYLNENRACRAFFDVLDGESKAQDQASGLLGDRRLST